MAATTLLGQSRGDLSSNFVDSERNEARSLIPGDSSDVWTAVQKEVEQFAHVCSYDRLGLGRSDKLAAPHTAISSVWSCKFPEPQ